MFCFDRKKFFCHYAESFEPANQKQEEALEFLLGKIEKDERWDDIRHIAYCLATFKWETGHTFEPVQERGQNSYFEKYNGRLGNVEPHDGFRFRGRGYVQLTGRINYMINGKKLGLDLCANPELALEPDTAYEIAARGMKEGWFTGKRLAQFIPSGKPADYVNARKIINSLDHAQDIAAIARTMEEVLKSSQGAIAA